MPAVPSPTYGVAVELRDTSGCSGNIRHKPEKVHNGYGQQHVANASTVKILFLFKLF